MLETPQGTVVHTGDFKFDLTPVNGQHADLHRMAEIGQRGVLALLSESTNAERLGFTPSERIVGEHIEEAFQQATGTIFLSTFASNVHRVQQVIDAAAKVKRKLALLGRSMVNVVETAASLGYLRLPDGMLIDIQDSGRYASHELVVLCTGSQGEPAAALARLANGTQRNVGIEPGDTVILASSPIPGNERNVGHIVDNLFQKKAKVIYGSGSATGMHVSGHGNQEELKLMLTLMKPHYLIPIHGEYRMLYQHRLLAESVGISPERIFIVNNGEVVDFVDYKPVLERKIPSGNTLVDGLGVGDIGQIVLRDRKLLSEDGILILAVTIAKSDRKIVAGPEIISRGFVYVRESEGLLDEVQRIAAATVLRLHEMKAHTSWSDYKQSLKAEVGKFLYAHTKRRPMILPIIIQV